MGYFSYIARQSFATAPNGERVFFRGTPWSRPYAIPDAATEERLFVKQRWMLRFFLGGLILTQPLLVWYAPQWIANPLYFVGYVAAVMLLERLIGFCVFRTELRKLHQLPQALPTQSFYESFAARHSPAMLRLGVWACVAFVAAGLVGMAMGQPNVIVAGLSAAFFAVCGWMWHYALKLKLAQPGLSVSGK